VAWLLQVHYWLWEKGSRQQHLSPYSEVVQKLKLVQMLVSPPVYELMAELQLTHLKRTTLLTASQENGVRIFVKIKILRSGTKGRRVISCRLLMPAAESVVEFNSDN
jgi:hypothetical protein